MLLDFYGNCVSWIIVYIWWFFLYCWNIKSLCRSDSICHHGPLSSLLLVAFWHQAIPLTNDDLSSVRHTSTYMYFIEILFKIQSLTFWIGCFSRFTDSMYAENGEYEESEELEDTEEEAEETTEEKKDSWVSVTPQITCSAVKLPWIFPGAPLNFNGAPGNIQGNLDRYAHGWHLPHSLEGILIWSLLSSEEICVNTSLVARCEKDRT